MNILDVVRLMHTIQCSLLYLLFFSSVCLLHCVANKDYYYKYWEKKIVFTTRQANYLRRLIVSCFYASQIASEFPLAQHLAS